MLLQMALFHSFLWLNNIPLYLCTSSSLSIPLLMDIYVASVAWLLDSATVNMGVQAAFWFMVFSGYMSSSGIDRSYDTCTDIPTT